MKIEVNHSYTWHGTDYFDLPEGKTKDDIDSVWMKWCHLTITFKDGTSFTQEMSDLEIDQVDFKFPDRMTVYEVDEEWNRVSEERIYGDE